MLFINCLSYVAILLLVLSFFFPLLHLISFPLFPKPFTAHAFQCKSGMDE